MRLIRASLSEAVEACIDAAGHEFDLSRQQTLLRAASYGQAFCRLVLRDVAVEYDHSDLFGLTHPLFAPAMSAQGYLGFKWLQVFFSKF